MQENKSVVQKNHVNVHTDVSLLKHHTTLLYQHNFSILILTYSHIIVTKEEQNTKVHDGTQIITHQQTQLGKLSISLQQSHFYQEQKPRHLE